MEIKFLGQSKKNKKNATMLKLENRMYKYPRALIDCAWGKLGDSSLIFFWTHQQVNCPNDLKDILKQSLQRKRKAEAEP